MHVTVLPRKPAGRGFKIDTTACSASNILLDAELDEGKEAMKTAEYRDITSAHTAVTLRLTKAYAQTDRVVIGDSRFGSCNTAEYLADIHGLDYILAVKTATAGYPKKRMREALGDKRGNRASFKVEVTLDKGTTPFFACGVLDKKPMYVVASCGTSIPTEVAQRKTRDAAGRTKTVEVPFPEMNALYRRYFNAVDLFNRSCFGVRSVNGAIKTKSWYRRLFLSFIGICETNAMNAYSYSVGHVERYEWLSKLSDALLNNPWA